jgi:hypothetical protein
VTRGCSITHFDVKEKDMKKFRTSTLVLFSLLLVPLRAPALDVDKCTIAAANEIKLAYSEMTPHLDTVISKLTFVDAKDREELKRKWSKLKIDCEDDRKKCSRAGVDDTGQWLGGYAHGGLGNTVNVCYYNLAEAGNTLCDLAGIIWHEKAHADGVKMDRKEHNDPATFPAALKDDVYRTGFAARDVCIADALPGSANRALKGATARGLGKACQKDSQCASDKCEKDTCVCRDDGDCFGNQKCKTPVTGKNYCK